jgi:hypothetical protein
MKTSKFTDEQIAMARRQVGSWADGDNRVTADRDGAVVDHSTSGVHRHYRPALDQKIYGFAGRSQPTAKPRERGGSHQPSSTARERRRTLMVAIQCATAYHRALVTNARG